MRGHLRRSFSRAALACLVTPLSMALVGTPATAADEYAKSPVAEARTLYLRGKYEEAREAAAKLAEKHPVETALLLARCDAAQGKYPEAEKQLTEALAKAAAKAEDAAAGDAKTKEQAPLYAELAALAFDRGDRAAAEKHAQAALSADGHNRKARWTGAELLRTAGKLEEADAAHDWFVDEYNNTDAFDDPDDIRYIGLGAAQYARWNRLSDQFSFLVNDLHPSALELDKDYWPAQYEAGLLFLEKYNEAEAAKAFQAALAINPNSAEVHAAVARLNLQNYNLDAAKKSVARAKDINPNLPAAHWAAADVALANFDAEGAIAELDAARKLNPIADETLGRLAAAYAVVDGWSDAAEKSDRFKAILAEVNARNPHAGDFYFAMAQAFDTVRRFPAAAQYYREAADRMPQLSTVRGELGLMLMRLGDEAQARKLLDASFEVDPFNVRVSNMRKVLDVLDDYALLETDHFIIRYDRIRDEHLAKYAADYLENEVYPELTKKFGFEPEGKSLFEIFNRSRNTGGHGWFSARMVGLPYVGTVGACAGKMVAMASPGDMDEKFNWARVLKHEFVHVLNLQQSRFNIPHWFTEALAVESEGYPRSEVWNRLLAERVPKKDLFNLDTINLGFVRPKSSLDWQMAYCQAQLYAQYMLKTYGDDALAKMLSAYRDNLNTRDALKRSFDVAQADFEKGYLDFVKSVADGLSAGAPRDAMTFAEKLKAHKDKPDDLDAAARLAAAYVDREEYADARKLADKVLEKSPKHPTASVTLARIKLVVGEDEAAAKLLADVLDTAKLDKTVKPDPTALGLLAGLRFKAGELAEAEKLYALGAEKFPHDVKWQKSLAKTYLLAKNTAKLRTTLVTLAMADADDLVIRKKLAQMALDESDFEAARRWAVDALHCDVEDAAGHRMLAAALEGLKLPAKAVEEYEVAVKLDPDEAESWAGLERAARAAGKDDVAERATKKEPKK
jgi:tetratricopeptide (TPR) repeat protein